MVVHSPIALFTFGALLEVVGARRRRTDLRAAGPLCLMGGSTIGVLAGAAGLTAVVRSGFPLVEVLRPYVASAASAIVGMLATTVLAWRAERVGRARASPAYRVVLLASLAPVTRAGCSGGRPVDGG